MVNKMPGGTAIYLQIAQELETLLHSLHYGEQIPSESELTARYGVSRGTIRQAIDFLVQRGDLYRQHGKGTFRGNGVQPSVRSSVPSYSGTLLAEGRIPAISNITLDSVSADAGTAYYLCVPVGEALWRLSRFRGEQGKAPGCFASAYLPKALFPALRAEDLEQSALEMLTKRFDVRISSTSNSVSVRAADAGEASRFSITPQTPLLIADFVVRDADEKPVFYDHSIHWDPAFRYRIETTYPV